MAKSDSGTHVITFDLQQIYMYLHSPTQSCFTFAKYGFTTLAYMNVILCVWSECIAAYEIASCLLQYITELKPTATKIVCYSDS